MNDRFFFLDIETTGLTLGQDTVLEIGIAVTDPELNVIATQGWLTYGYGGDDWWPSHLDPVVQEMHTKNGLFEALRGFKYDEKRTVAEILEFLLRYASVSDLRRTPMAGSSVHFDRKFLAAHFPIVEAMFSYRNLDVSTVTQCFEAWAPLIAKGRPRNEKAHRAVPDAVHSLEVLKYFRKWLPCDPS